MSPPENDHATAALLESVERPLAFRTVFDAHHGDIRRYLHHRVGNPADAEDLAAEVFARAFSVRRRFRDTGVGVRPWLFAIATNLLRDEARRRSRERALRQRLRPAPALLEPLDADPDPQLRQALSTLRAAELETLLLHAWGELTYAEIAVATATEVGTVRSRLSRARAHMRAALQQTAVSPLAFASSTEGAPNDPAARPS